MAISSNRFPIALCRDATVSAGADGLAASSIDLGSDDPDAGDILSLTQSHAGPYPLGQTMVTLTVTDDHGASNQCTAMVTVVDNTPPNIGPCPADQTVSAIPPAGAVVAFATPAASDNCSVAGITCTPASSSTFAIGTTTVTCTAMDGSGNVATCRFTVKVLGTAEQLTKLIALVETMSI